MSNVKSFTIGKEKYNAAMASAVGQDELLSYLTAGITERLIGSPDYDEKQTDALLIAMFMAMRSDVKKNVSDILMAQVFQHGTSIPVDINSFSGRMVEYNTLLAQLLQWNLADFFTWLESVRKEGEQPTQAKVN